MPFNIILQFSPNKSAIGAKNRVIHLDTESKIPLCLIVCLCKLIRWNFLQFLRDFFILWNICVRIIRFLCCLQMNYLAVELSFSSFSQTALQSTAGMESGLPAYLTITFTFFIFPFCAYTYTVHFPFVLALILPFFVTVATFVLLDS